ncbi:MAG: Maf family protein [Porticoccaceae bacterium]|nr:Maf family protein [Porticoccaceae bacterium]
MTTPQLLLASASPRRRDLLEQIGVNFLVLAVDIDESRRDQESPVDYVSRLAVEKAQAGFSRQQGQLPSLGADTIVVFENQIFGKPQDQKQAEAMLMTLSGKVHSVFTAVAIDNGTDTAMAIAETRVGFRTISQSECQIYWQTGEPQGKAGAYAIQGRGGVFVEKLEGSYSAVVGLPLAETEQLLKKFSVPLWNTGTK